MTSCYLDANILNYFEDVKSSFHQQTYKLLAKLVRNQTKLIISPLVLDEFIFSLRKKLFREGETKPTVHTTLAEALELTLELPRLNLVNPPLTLNTQKEVPKLMQKYSLKPRDAYHLLTMKANGINKIATFDTDFEKVAKAGVLEVIK